MDKIRLGIIGVGAQGSYHIGCLKKGLVPEVELCALCDNNPARLAKAQSVAGAGVDVFDDAGALFQSGRVDAVIVSTPHFLHPVLATRAMEHDLHVMVEKPAGVYTKQVRRLNEVAKKSGKVFGVMLNQRTNPVYQKLRQLVNGGELGQVYRNNWIITDWFRPQYYYDEGGWRATWAGEGGGVLLNQNPHNFDLWQWICGLPKRVFAFTTNGKYHDIEVEDDVTAYVEYENGATGVYVTSTGEAPGTNRFEVVGERGKVVVEDGKLTFWRLEVPVSEFSKTSQNFFAKPPTWVCQVPAEGGEGAHPAILGNWARAILHGEKLIAPGEEGILGLEMSNAVHLSAWTGRWVELPVDEDAFYSELEKRMKTSAYQPPMEDAYVD